jgi:putative phosphoesterase
MRVGVISDTHGRIPAPVFDIFEKVDLIIHAGDIDEYGVITDLSTIAPVKAVAGNMDGYISEPLKQIEYFKLEHKICCLTHIIPSVREFAYHLFKQDKMVDIVVFGHTHKAEKTMYNDILFLNPGSASRPRYEPRGSVAVLKISNTVEADIHYI